MTVPGFALFDAAIGPCGIAWSGMGVAGVQLPERDARRTRARLRHRFPGANEAVPPPAIQAAIGAIVALLRGERRDLSSVALDMEGIPQFHRRVYEVARTVPPGGTMTYGEIATRLGDPGAARDVGQALARNPFALIVPCHRVLAANGKLGGFSAAGGVTTKATLLKIEGAPMFSAPSLFDDVPGL